MTNAVMEHLHADMEELKQDLAVIKHVLCQEGKLTEYAKELLAEARATPDSEYVSHQELKKKILL